MNRVRSLTVPPPAGARRVARLIGALALSVALAPLASHADAVALVTEVAGAVSRVPARGALRPLTLADELRVGDTLALGPDGRLVAAFTQRGTVLQARGPGRVRVTADALRPRQGSPQIESRPLPPAIAALRIRPVTAALTAIVMRGGGALVPLAPRGLQLAAGARVLRWTPLAAAAGYRVRLIDDDGQVLLDAGTGDAWLELPATLPLERGREYIWTVAADGAAATAAPGAAAFMLADETVEARIAAARAAVGEVFADRVALAVALAQLGLQQEAEAAWRALGAAPLAAPAGPR